MAGIRGKGELSSTRTGGLTEATLHRDGDSIQEHFVTITPERGESPSALFKRTASVLRDSTGQVVVAQAFGMGKSDLQYLRLLTSDGRFPIAAVRSQPPSACQESSLFGLHVWMIAGVGVSQLTEGGRILGSAFEDDHAWYCRLAGLLPADMSVSQEQQAQDIFRQMEAILKKNRMGFTNVCRTWFFNSQILAWYRQFNVARDRFFRDVEAKHGAPLPLLPASTGIGGFNAEDAALTAGLLAVKPKKPGANPDSPAQVYAIPSPLQPPAPSYGSSFSRAVEMALPDHRRLYISGTASIDPAGKTLFCGDTKAQVRQTMEVVEAILGSREMGWQHVTRSVAYFKRADDAPLLDADCAANGIPPFPVIVVENDVCRDDLLFEIEVDAIKA